MKFLKVVALIIVPVIIAAMFTNSIVTIGDIFNLFETGVNYTPLLGVAFGFAWLFTAYATACLLFPMPTTTQAPVKAATPVYTHPCYFTIQHA